MGLLTTFSFVRYPALGVSVLLHLSSSSKTLSRRINDGLGSVLLGNLPAHGSSLGVSHWVAIASRVQLVFV
jgi:hypothetical protein